MTVLGVFLMDKSGRRPLLLVSCWRICFIVVVFNIFWNLIVGMHEGLCRRNMLRMLPCWTFVLLAGSFNHRIHCPALFFFHIQYLFQERMPLQDLQKWGDISPILALGGVLVSTIMTLKIVIPFL